ncbi:MAG: response regulator transcription factor [Bacteroidota bacterium]
MIHVAIVEDDIELKNYFEEVVSSGNDLSLIGSYDNAEDFIADFNRINMVNVVMMDINLPGMSGIECIGKLKKRQPETQYLVCSIFEDSTNLFSALCAGATGYILKNSTEEEIMRAVNEIHRGGSPMSPQLARMVVQSFPLKKGVSELIDLLTSRERDILQMLSEGFRYKEIADKLCLSTETVRAYIRDIYSKLQVHSRTDALNKVFQK